MKIKLILIILFQGLLWADGKYPPILKIGYVKFTPYVFLNGDNKVSGPIVEYITKLFPDYDIEWLETPLPRVSRSLNDKKIDLFATYFKTPEREKELGYPKYFYTKLTPTICSLNAPLTQDLRLLLTNKYHTIAAIRGVKLPDEILKNPLVKLLEVVPDEYVEKSQKLLEENRADFIFFGKHANVQDILSKSNSKITCLEINQYAQELYITAAKDSPFLKEVDLRIQRNGILKY